jgi:hypothetical protein
MLIIHGYRFKSTYYRAGCTYTLSWCNKQLFLLLSYGDRIRQNVTDWSMYTKIKKSSKK